MQLVKLISNFVAVIHIHRSIFERSTDVNFQLFSLKMEFVHSFRAHLSKNKILNHQHLYTYNKKTNCAI